MSEEGTTIGFGVATRRVLLAGAGAIGAGVVLDGCGNDGVTGGATATSSGSDPATPTDATGDDPVRVARTSDVPVGGGAVFASHGVVVTQPTAGTFKAFSAVCTHQGCPIAGIDGGTINCTCHGSKFSIEDGSVRNGPATKPLEARKLMIDGDAIAIA